MSDIGPAAGTHRLAYCHRLAAPHRSRDGTIRSPSGPAAAVPTACGDDGRRETGAVDDSTTSTALRPPVADAHRPAPRRERPDEQEWHMLLAGRDRERHAAERATGAADLTATLERRLVEADALVRTLRQGVALRDQIIREQGAALARERDQATGRRGVPDVDTSVGATARWLAGGLRRRAVRLVPRRPA